MTGAGSVSEPSNSRFAKGDVYVCVDLFSGLGGFSTAFEQSGDWNVVTVDNQERFNPDICANVLDLRHDELPDADVILASPPCTAFSMAASGTHLDSDGNPISDWGRESILLVRHTVGLIEAINPDWWFLENPMGGMRKFLGQPDAHIWWCQYGSNRAKPTDFWGDIPPTFTAQSCRNEAPDCNHQSAPRGSDTGTQSSDKSAAERAKIPHKLSQAVRDACETAFREEIIQQSTLADIDTRKK